MKHKNTDSKEQAQDDTIKIQGFTYAPVMLDIEGTTLSSHDIRRLENPLVGGVILFTRNWRNRNQLIQLTNSIKEIRPDMLIAVDHEGGRVQRFRTDGFTEIPPMHAIGVQWENYDMKKPGMGALAAMESATACGYVLASELRSCGVDLSFGPLLDLDWGFSKVIGDRAFSHDPRVVSLLAKSVMHGMHMAGMANCGKHFPGHGYASGDSHIEIPMDNRSLETILEMDSLPYQTIGIALDSIMTAHVIYPRIDDLPVTFSKKWLQKIVREDLDFKGCIFSDDLTMEAARSINGKQLGLDDAALRALDAGCDVILVCNQSVVDQGKGLDRLLESLAKVKGDEFWKTQLHSEYRRRVLLPRSEAIQWEYLMAEPNYQNAKMVIAEL